MADDLDIQLFNVIYNQNSGKSMQYIQAEFTKAKIAIAESDAQYKEFIDRFDYNLKMVEKAGDQEALPEDEKEEVEKPITLMIKKPSDIKKTITETSITCCICGKTFKTLGAHLKRSHKTTAEAYCKACGFPEKTPLMSGEFYRAAQNFAKNAFGSRLRNKNAAAAAASEGEGVANEIPTPTESDLRDRAKDLNLEEEDMVLSI